jgi:CheY-like chemotaxis protein
VRILILEDNPADLKIASEIAHQEGFTHIETYTTLFPVLNRLEEGQKDDNALPEVILVDLDLGLDSGYELVRVWHSTPQLSRIKLIVWSHLGEEHQSVCDLFKVDCYVPKWKGVAALRESLKEQDASSREHRKPKQ